MLTTGCSGAGSTRWTSPVNSGKHCQLLRPSSRWQHRLVLGSKLAGREPGRHVHERCTRNGQGKRGVQQAIVPQRFRPRQPVQALQKSRTLPTMQPVLMLASISPCNQSVSLALVSSCNRVCSRGNHFSTTLHEYLVAPAFHDRQEKQEGSP
mgnify:CR=1 FL=1